jgi:hypothetical protein
LESEVLAVAVVATAKDLDGGNRNEMSLWQHSDSIISKRFDSKLNHCSSVSFPYNSKAVAAAPLRGFLE